MKAEMRVDIAGLSTATMISSRFRCFGRDTEHGCPRCKCATLGSLPIRFRRRSGVAHVRQKASCCTRPNTAPSKVCHSSTCCEESTRRTRYRSLCCALPCSRCDSSVYLVSVPQNVAFHSKQSAIFKRRTQTRGFAGSTLSCIGQEHGAYLTADCTRMGAQSQVQLRWMRLETLRCNESRLVAEEPRCL
jgi:hypothetical protein